MIPQQSCLKFNCKSVYPKFERRFQLLTMESGLDKFLQFRYTTGGFIWASGAVVAQIFYKNEVGGSNPSSPTKITILSTNSNRWD